MRFVKSLVAAGMAMLAGLALKKMVSAIEKQAEAQRVKREDMRDPSEFKRLKQDPATGVYYAED
jgi:hypothetical protein